MHARDAAIEGSKALVIKANVTDILVIAVSVLPQLQEIGVETLCTAFGHGVGMKQTRIRSDGGHMSRGWHQQLPRVEHS